MNDVISRKSAIDAIESTDWYHQNSNGDMVLGANSSVHQPWYKADEILAVIENLPSAQPEITLESAIDYLHSIGWMQEHDRALTERKTGRWELGPFDRLGGYWTTCSVCERPSFGGGKYCRYCGADMRTPTQVQMDEADDVMMGGDNGETD